MLETGFCIQNIAEQNICGRPGHCHACGGAAVLETDEPEDQNGEMVQPEEAFAYRNCSRKGFRESEATLPQWLDDLLFKTLEADYHPGNQRFQYTMDLSDEEIKVYLGTYFPRSYCEMFCIARNLFRNESYLSSLKSDLSLLKTDLTLDNEINILDIGCGTGGEIVGLLDVICKYLIPARINIYAFDGHRTALKRMKQIVDNFQPKFTEINVKPKPHEIQTEVDIHSIAEEARDAKVKFNFILCCKMCCELIKKHITYIPYSSVAYSFSELLKPSGLLLILDVTTRLENYGWLPTALNWQLSLFDFRQNVFGTLIPKSCGKHPECGCSCYTKQVFSIRHTHLGDSPDLSKVCYRIICRNSLRDKILQNFVVNGPQIINQERYYSPQKEFWRDGACQYSVPGSDADAFNINLTTAETPWLLNVPTGRILESSRTRSAMEMVQITTDSGETAEAIAPVIISASRSTDIPAFYAKWFFYRLSRGYCVWYHPFSRRKVYVSFRNTRVIVFWTKNPKPMMPYLHILDEMGIHYYFQFTLNDYEAEGFEPCVPSLASRIETFRELSSMIGRSRVIWRFDPLLFAPDLCVRQLLNKIWHVGNAIRGYTKKLVFSFVDVSCYRKVQNNLIRETGLFSKDTVSQAELSPAEIYETASGLVKIREAWAEQGWNVRMATCTETIDLESFGIEHNSCIDADLIERLFGNDRELVYFLHTGKHLEPDLFGPVPEIPPERKNLKDSGQSEACGCILSKDIGMCNTCRHLCVYCYANTSKELVELNKNRHSWEKESIID